MKANKLLLRDSKRSEKIKIVYLIGELGKGGSERQLYLLLKHMNLELLDPYVVVFNSSKYGVYHNELRSIGIKIFEIPKGRKSIQSRMVFLYELFKEINPHIVHSWTLHDNPYAGIVGFLAGVPIRIGSMRASLHYKGYKSLSRLMKFLSLMSVHHLLLNSESFFQELKEKKYPSHKIILLENCVEIVEKHNNSISSNLRSVGLTKKQQIIGSIGNLTRNKNHHFFIEGLAKLLPTNPSLAGIIVGQPIENELVYFDELKNLTASLHVDDRLMVIGFCDNVPELMHDLYALCLLSNTEGTPNVILEAMAASCPVIATNVGGIPNLVINHHNGILIDPGDLCGFIESLKFIIDHPDTAKAFGQAGYELVKSKYDCAIVAEKLTNIYLELLEKNDNGI